MNLFLKYKTMIMRILGVLMLLVGFSIHFWVTPKEGLTANDKAAARIARMEASTQAKNTQSKASKREPSKFLDSIKETQAKQIKYLTLLAMIFGIGFLGYSFIPKKEDEKS